MQISTPYLNVMARTGFKNCWTFTQSRNLVVPKKKAKMLRWKTVLKSKFEALKRKVQELAKPMVVTRSLLPILRAICKIRTLALSSLLLILMSQRKLSSKIVLKVQKRKETAGKLQSKTKMMLRCQSRKCSRVRLKLSKTMMPRRSSTTSRIL